MTRRIRPPRGKPGYWISPEDFTAVALGVAGGHLWQVQQILDGGPRRAGKDTPPPHILALEHLDCACQWLIDAAETRAT